MVERLAKIIAAIFGIIILYIGGWYAKTAWNARRPSDMPADSVWIDAPAVPFVYYHGGWFGCWIDRDGKSNRCRLWDGNSDQPLWYEGLYVSCETKLPVPANELHVISPKDWGYMWVGDGHGNDAPVALLANGKVLTPVEIPQGCEHYWKQMHR